MAGQKLHTPRAWLKPYFFLALAFFLAGAFFLAAFFLAAFFFGAFFLAAFFAAANAALASSFIAMMFPPAIEVVCCFGHPKAPVRLPCGNRDSYCYRKNDCSVRPADLALPVLTGTAS